MPPGAELDAAVNSYINDRVASGKGLGTASVTATGGTAGVPGTSTRDAHRERPRRRRVQGLHGDFLGDVTQALNGVKCGVVDNTTTAITLDCVLPANPGADSVTLYPRGRRAGRPPS